MKKTLCALLAAGIYCAASVETSEFAVAIAHFIFNSTGTAYDSIFVQNSKADVTWNCSGLKVVF